MCYESLKKSVEYQTTAICFVTKSFVTKFFVKPMRQNLKSISWRTGLQSHSGSNISQVPAFAFSLVHYISYSCANLSLSVVYQKQVSVEFFLSVRFSRIQMRSKSRQCVSSICCNALENKSVHSGLIIAICQICEASCCE